MFKRWSNGRGMFERWITGVVGRSEWWMVGVVDGLV